MNIFGIHNASEKPAIQVRTALRAFGGLDGLMDQLGGCVTDELALQVRLQAFRLIFVRWSSLYFGDVRDDATSEALAAFSALFDRVQNCVATFYRDAAGWVSSDYFISSKQEELEAAWRACALIEMYGSGKRRARPFKSVRDDMQTLAFSGPDGWDNGHRWADAHRAAIQWDGSALSGGMPIQDLLMEPLWPRGGYAALETNFVTPVRKGLRPEAETWLRERKDGELLLSKRPRDVATRMTAIANLPRAFWERESFEQTVEAVDYALHGDMANDHWGR